MRACAISFAYEIGNDIFDSNAFRDSGQHRIISSCTPIFFLGSHGAMGRHAATKAARGGRLGAADRARRDRALHPKAKPKAKTKRRYQWICMSSGSEDFGLPYSPKERAARNQKGRGGSCQTSRRGRRGGGQRFGKGAGRLRRGSRHVDSCEG